MDDPADDSLYAGLLATVRADLQRARGHPSVVVAFADMVRCHGEVAGDAGRRGIDADLVQPRWPPAGRRGIETFLARHGVPLDLPTPERPRRLRPPWTGRS